MIEPQVGQVWSYGNGWSNKTIRLVARTDRGFERLNLIGESIDVYYLAERLKRSWHIELGPEIKGSEYWRGTRND